MQNKVQRKREILKTLKQIGYTNQAGSRSIVSKLNNDLISYFVVEAPTVLIYVWFAVYPAYMPPFPFPGFLPYAERLNDSASPDFAFSMDDDDSVTLQTLEKLKQHIVTVIETMLEIASTKNKNVEGLCNLRDRGIIRFTPSAYHRLKMYQALFKGDYSDALFSMDMYLKAISSGMYTKRVVENAIAEVEPIETLIKANDAIAISYILDSNKELNCKAYGIKMQTKSEKFS